MFSEHLPDILELASRIDTGPRIGPREVSALLEKAAAGDSLADGEILSLVNGISEPANAREVTELAARYPRPHDDRVLLLPPLYFSSICENTCAYCDFSTGNGVRLSPSGFQHEVETLVGLGYRSIELVSSQDPCLYVHEEPFSLADQRFQVEGAARYFEILRNTLSSNGGGMITSNIPPVDTASFRQLRGAGLDCFLAWLETFDSTQYGRLHTRRGPKGNQAFRLDSFDRAREAGVRHVAGAFLKGLFDWRKEEIVLYLLDRHLKTTWGHGFSIIGTPRVKGRFLGSSVIQESRMSDEEYELNIALDRILFDGILWLQTRESFETNRELIGRYGGGVILTLTSSTAPGGYSEPTEATAQFPVYKQDLDDAVATLARDGLNVRFDWTARDLEACQRMVGRSLPPRLFPPE